MSSAEPLVIRISDSQAMARELSEQLRESEFEEESGSVSQERARRTTTKDRPQVIPKLVSAREVATAFSLDESTVRKWARTGLLPCYRLGRSVRFNLAEVESAFHKTDAWRK